MGCWHPVVLGRASVEALGKRSASVSHDRRRQLRDAVITLVEGGPIPAYELLLEGPGHVAGLGPAFFTKFLYFVGYDQSSSGQLRPLILDRYVARGLNKLRGTSWSDAGWRPSTYADYLWWARSEAQGDSVVTTEDEAEYKIWHHGRDKCANADVRGGGAVGAG